MKHASTSGYMHTAFSATQSYVQKYSAAAQMYFTLYAYMLNFTAVCKRPN